MNTYSTRELSTTIAKQSEYWTEAQVNTLMNQYQVLNEPKYDNRGFVKASTTGGVNAFGVDQGWKDKATCRFTEKFHDLILRDCREILTGTDIEDNNQRLLSYLKNKKNESVKEAAAMDFGKELELMLAKAKDYDVMADRVKKTEAELEKEIQNREELELTIRDLKSQVGQLMDEKNPLPSLQKDMSVSE